MVINKTNPIMMTKYKHHYQEQRKYTSRFVLRYSLGIVCAGSRLWIHCCEILVTMQDAYFGTSSWSLPVVSLSPSAMKDMRPSEELEDAF